MGTVPVTLNYPEIQYPQIFYLEGENMTRNYLVLALFFMVLHTSLTGCNKEPIKLSEEEENYLDKAYFTVYQYDELVNIFIKPDSKDSLSGEQLLGGAFAIGMFKKSLEEEFVPEQFKEIHQNIMKALSITNDHFTPLTVSIARDNKEDIKGNIQKIQPSIDTIKEIRSELEKVYNDAGKEDRIEYIRLTSKDSLDMFN